MRFEGCFARNWTGFRGVVDRKRRHRFHLRLDQLDVPVIAHCSRWADAKDYLTFWATPADSVDRQYTALQTKSSIAWRRPIIRLGVVAAVPSG